MNGDGLYIFFLARRRPEYGDNLWSFATAIFNSMLRIALSIENMRCRTRTTLEVSVVNVLE